MRKISPVCVVMFGLLGALHVGAANLVMNPGFETGDFSNWTVVDLSSDGAPGYSGDGTEDLNPSLGVAAASYGYPAHSGHDYAYFGVGGTTVSLSQVIATTVGTGYTINLFLTSDYSADPTHGYTNSVSGSFGTAPPLAILNLPGTQDSSGNETYTEYTFYGFATSATTTLTLSFRNDAGQFSLDDLAIAAGTPEPATFLLVVPAFAGLLLLARRRRAA